MFVSRLKVVDSFSFLSFYFAVRARTPTVTLLSRCASRLRWKTWTHSFNAPGSAKHGLRRVLTERLLFSLRKKAKWKRTCTGLSPWHRSIPFCSFSMSIFGFCRSKENRCEKYEDMWKDVQMWQQVTRCADVAVGCWLWAVGCWLLLLRLVVVLLLLLLLRLLLVMVMVFLLLLYVFVLILVSVLTVFLFSG